MYSIDSFYLLFQLVLLAIKAKKAKGSYVANYSYLAFLVSSLFFIVLITIFNLLVARYLYVAI